jgi:imidazolonepropionase-like amidohydrolase
MTGYSGTPPQRRPGFREAHRLALALALALASATVLPAQRPGEGVVVITGANLIDGASDAPRRGVTVVVRGRTIERIADGRVQPPAGATVIDARGRWLLPGLIDAHTHISSLASARRALESGVTTVRSASTQKFEDVGLRELARRGVIAGPDVVAAGLFVTPELGDAVLADPRLAALPQPVVEGDALRRLVRLNLERGVDVIKTRGTERAGLPSTDPRRQTYTEGQLRAIVQEAATRDVPVMAHAHGDEGARAAVLAGVRSIEHGTYLSDTTLRLMKERGTYLVPTYATVVDLVQPGGDYDDPILHVRGTHMLPRLRATVERAHRMGIPIVAGADTQYGPESVTRVAHEVAAFTEMGMTPLEAIRAATTVAAELLGIAERTGTIAAGREADLIIVEGNPLEDIRALQDVLVVVSNGQVALNRLPFGREAEAVP